MTTFSIGKFRTFCASLTIDSKELGQITLERLMGTQQYVIEEIAAGLAEGIHEFVILKGRQLGISTITLAIDLYWLFKHPGLQALLVTDTDENRDLFRSYVTQYTLSLPATKRPDIDKDNRAQLLFKPTTSRDPVTGIPKRSNGSRLVYLVAGTKKQGNLGRGKAGNYLHATEMSSWGDEEGYGSLMNTLAQTNPDRLYIFESTARGYNMFYEHWEQAKASKTSRAIFVGWWRNQFYRKERHSTDFKTYWDGEPTSDETVWVKDVWERYRYEITPEQLAWWRWYVTERMKGDELLALQEMPPTEDYAFQLSGSKFFSAERVNQHYQVALAASKDPMQQPALYRYKFGLNFEDTEFIETNADLAEVEIWELPDPAGVYIVAADPAYGSSEWADEFAAQVLRCYADRVEQVAQVHTPDWTEAQFAWVLAHLAGSYSSPVASAMLCLEMQGPGSTVFNELQNLKRQANDMRGPAEIWSVVGAMRHYFWKKQDALFGAFSFQWQTNSKEKIRMMSTLRSYFEREALMLHSVALLQQFRNIHRDGDKIGGEGRAKDDMVISLAIGVVCWNDQIMKEMQRDNRTYARERRPAEEPKAMTQLESQVFTFLKAQGVSVPGIGPAKGR